MLCALIKICDCQFLLVLAVSQTGGNLPIRQLAPTHPGQHSSRHHPHLNVGESI